MLNVDIRSIGVMNENNEDQNCSSSEVSQFTFAITNACSMYVYYIDLFDFVKKRQFGRGKMYLLKNLLRWPIFSRWGDL